ncbi:Hypothetical protein PHPALM_14945 [Phytophthora palmivora]|uniref:PiggyBac transposable element-derived protein domain-containing protein n=1 Tax=Phytophthora palmivora TaxID=4796 RepID=A0A2P4XTF1_9STRA|nr:Hypothetical protein PHPALM_14945 [Phytophthora palmivora]
MAGYAVSILKGNDNRQELLGYEESESFQRGDDDDDDLQEVKVFDAYESAEFLSTTLAEVEAAENIRFELLGTIEAPSDLYKRNRDTTATYLRSAFRHIFEHSASSSFYAFLLQYFWYQVLHETNAYPVAYTGFCDCEVYTILEIMFFLTLKVKGECANYWGPQPEDVIFGSSTTSLGSVMLLHRFKLHRQYFSFNASPSNMDKDAAARVRPMLNLWKTTGGRYVVAERYVPLKVVAARSPEQQAT